MNEKAVARKSFRSAKRASYFKKTWMLYAMLVLPLAFFLVFRYAPMSNIVIAFKNYNMFVGVWESPWAGMRWFEKAFASTDFYNVVRNTITLNLLDLFIGFPMPIILAILLNELPFRRYKRTTQTIIYLPHFLSWVVVSGLAKELFSPQNGVINVFLTNMGANRIDFLQDNVLWIITYILVGLWKEMGWNTIIYLAAITGVNPELYEAAEVDGAGRLRKIWHVMLPGIRPTIVVLLIMSIGRILGSELDRPYTMGNAVVRPVADVISTFVYRTGIKGGPTQFSYATAIGLFQSVVCVIFLLIANTVAKKFGERGIW